MPRWVVLFALLPNCTGCLYYAYPTVTHTPELAVENRDGNVHAFRVDIDRLDRKPAAVATQYTFSRIPIDGRGLVPSQLELASSTGLLNPLGVVDGGEHERSQYTLLIRLYKPGSRTVEVKAWDKSRAIDWSAAPTLVDQEKAIDDLLAVPAAPDQPTRASWWEFKDEKNPPFGLQLGRTSPEQKRTLQFAAGEYARLSNGPLASGPNQETARVRLQAKAVWLRRHAENEQ